MSVFARSLTYSLTHSLTHSSAQLRYLARASHQGQETRRPNLLDWPHSPGLEPTTANMRGLSGARILPVLLLSALPVGVLGADVLSTDGFSQCITDGKIEVEKLDITYDRTSRKLVFDVAGVSKEESNVTAMLVVTAYGKELYTKSFSPCDEDMSEMCPGKRVPAREALCARSLTA